MTGGAEKSGEKEDVENEEKLETTGDTDNQSTPNEIHNEQAPKGSSSLIEHEVNNRVTKEVENDGLKDEVQDKPNDVEEQSGKLVMHVHNEHLLLQLQVKKV